MAIQVQQESTAETSRRWKWKVWLEGSADELDQLQSVEYELHRTFKNPIRLVTDRASGFMLQSSGWGEFMIHIMLHYKDGHTEKIQHWLRLVPGAHPRGGAPVRSKLKGERATVYISAGLADSEFAEKMKAAFRRLGMKVLSEDDLLVGGRLESAVRLMTEKADLCVAVVSPDTSPWVESEVAEMLNQHTLVIPLMRGDLIDLPPSMRELKAIRVDQGANADSLAEQIVEIMPGLTTDDP